MNPMPPCWASAIASRDSVTVSMAALTTGIFSAILRVRQVRISASAGSTLLRAGSRSTSSNVKASGRGEFSIYQYSLSHAGASHHPLGCALAPRSNSRLQAWPQARFRRSQANLLIFVLELVELPIDAALRQQLLVRAALPQPSFMHHQNPVGALNRRKPVGHNDRRTAGDDAAESFAHAELSLRIDAGRRLVQDQKLRVVGQRPGEINELLLPRGKGAAALADLLVKSRGQRADEVGQIYLFRRLFHALIGYGFGAQPDVRGDGPREEVRLLQYHAEPPAQFDGIKFPDVNAVNQHAPAAYIVETQQQAEDGCLAGSGMAHQRDGFPGLYGEAQVFEHPLFAVVGEPNVLKLDASFSLTQGRRPGGRLNSHRSIQQLENTLGAGHSRLQDIVFLAEILDRAEYAERILHEGHQHANGHFPGEDPIAAVDEQRRHSEGSQPFYGWIKQAMGQNGVLVSVTVVRIDGGEPLAAALFVIEK